jgi:hypothetical protein
MQRQQVVPEKAGQVRSIGYSPETSELEIEFSSGGVYRYAGVPRDVYDDFIHAESLGSFVATRIRGAYEFTRLHIEGCSEWYHIEDCKPDCLCWCHKITKAAKNAQERKPDEKKKASKKASTKKARV